MDESSKPRPCSGGSGGDDDDGEKARAEQLLEDRWFFSNLLHRKTTMSSTNSDDPPRTSSKYYSRHHDSAAGKSYEETYETIKKLSGPSITGLTRAPSMPERKSDSNTVAKYGHCRRRRRRGASEETPASNNIARAPSLPAKEIIQFQDEEEIEFSMGKLIRQASLEDSDAIIPPTNRAPNKGVAAIISCSTSPRKPEFDNLKLERLRVMSRLKTQKSLSDLELQGFKDLGLTNLNQELERKEEEEVQGRNTRRSPYLSSEAWRRPHDSAPPPVSKWGGERSTAQDDIKAQIKFWARAVASNVSVKNAS